jgi:hypothetical protein
LRSDPPFGDDLLVNPVAFGQNLQAVLPMLYRSTERLCRRGAPPVKNKDDRSKPRIKHLVRVWQKLYLAFAFLTKMETSLLAKPAR